MSKESMKHFGLYSDSKMKSMTKDELIEYVHLIYNNWKNCDETAEKIVNANLDLFEENKLLKREVKALDEEGVMKCELNEKLSKALDKICNRQAYLSFCHGTVRSNIKCNDEKECAKCWREWCLKNE